MADAETDSTGKLAPQPTPDQIEQWWAMHTMHPAHGACQGLEYRRDCPSCEAGDTLRRLGFDPYGEGITLFVGLVQDHRRLLASGETEPEQKAGPDAHTP